MKGEILKKEIIKLQKQMKIHHIDWYIIPTTDYHGSEYVHPHFRFREFLSGFTGSAGTLLVNLDAAYLWTDGRYFLQAEAELFGSEITLMKTGEPDVPGLSQFLKNHISENQTLGFDGRLISIELGQKLEKICSELNANLVWNIDLADEVWKERPKLIPSPIYRLPPEVTGHSFQEKLTALQQKMASCKTDVIILTALEEIAWLFNMRGSDIEHTPVFYSFVAITRTDYTLFAPQDMLPEDFPKNRVCRYSDINVYLSNIDSDMRVWLCKSQGSYWMLKHLCKTSKLNFNQTPIALMKAIKNNVEDLVSHMVDPIVLASKYPEEWDFETLNKNLRRINREYIGKTSYTTDELVGMTAESLKGEIFAEFEEMYRAKEREIGEEQMREVERMILLRVVDNLWMDQIDAMDQLKEGIGLRALGQQDPVAAYAQEGFEMFDSMINEIKEETVNYCYSVTLDTDAQRHSVIEIGGETKAEDVDDSFLMAMQGGIPEDAEIPEREHKQDTVKRSHPKIGRNDPCPCGSGKKYKHCCMKKDMEIERENRDA